MLGTMRELAVLFMLLNAVELKTLPSFIKPCKRDNPKLLNCVGNAIIDLIPTLCNEGIPSLQVPKLDPVQVSHVDLYTNSFNVTLDNIIIRGLNSTYLDDLALKNIDDPTTLHVCLKMREVQIQSDYFIAGQISAVEINGGGVMATTFSHNHASIHLTAKHVVQNDRKHFAIDSLRVYINLANIVPQFDNLTQEENDLIRRNWSDIYKLLKESIDDKVTHFLRPVLQNLFETYAIDDLFP